ncbi:HNH endonuclease [Flavobacterium sp. RHBU_3]|uniref:HNH endonuclease n=1 Tax=Flavobacterium sp. RHBU_3 TaxID=3391184 RepID=UPI0039852BC3
MVILSSKISGVKIHLNGQFTEEYRIALEDFTMFYDFIDITYDPNNKSSLKSKNDRVCRFCQKSSPDVSFKKSAHLIPEFMGNRNLLSDFECDTCNMKMSRYEDSFAKFFGADRTFSQMKGKKGSKTFKNSKIEVREIKEDGKAKIRITPKLLNGEKCYNIDEDNKSIIIENTKHSYIPLDIFKVLCKIAFSLIPESELEKFEKLRTLILQNTFDDKILKGNDFFRAYTFKLNWNEYKRPIVMMFKKRLSYKDQNIPSWTFVLCFNKFVYQFFLPFCEEDNWLYNKSKEVTFKILPPLISEELILNFGNPTMEIFDFSSYELLKCEKEKIILYYETKAKVE